MAQAGSAYGCMTKPVRAKRPNDRIRLDRDIRPRRSGDGTRRHWTFETQGLERRLYVLNRLLDCDLPGRAVGRLL
jgi:hypothetical protein